MEPGLERFELISKIGGEKQQIRDREFLAKSDSNSQAIGQDCGLLGDKMKLPPNMGRRKEARHRFSIDETAHYLNVYCKNT